MFKKLSLLKEFYNFGIHPIEKQHVPTKEYIALSNASGKAFEKLKKQLLSGEELTEREAEDLIQNYDDARAELGMYCEMEAFIFGCCFTANFLAEVFE